MSKRNVLVVVGALVVLALAGIGIGVAMQGGGSERDQVRASGEEMVDVTLMVTGDRRTADVSYSVGGDRTRLNAAVLPVRRTVRMPEDGRLSVLVQNTSGNGPGTVTCTVVVGERVISQKSQFGTSAVAQCADVVPTDPTVPGAKAPTLTKGNGALPGETRLTRTVPVKQYPGQGSPTAGRVSDTVSRLSYMSFDGAWERSRMVDPQMQGFERKQAFESEASWEALIASGQVKTELLADAKGRDRLRTLAEAMQDYRQKVGFDDTARGRDVASEPITVSGHKGWVVVREVRFKKEGIRATMDLAAVAVVDTGRPRPSFLYVDIPDTHKRLYPDINTVIDSLRVS